MPSGGSGDAVVGAEGLGRRDAHAEVVVVDVGDGARLHLATAVAAHPSREVGGVGAEVRVEPRPGSCIMHLTSYSF